MPWTNVPQCERCWIDDNISSTEDNEVSVRIPVRALQTELNICHQCNQLTLSGIWVRAEVTQEEKDAYER